MVNEDPNAKLVRELRAEVERLKQMLISANPDLMLDKAAKPRHNRLPDNIVFLYFSYSDANIF